MNSSNTIGDHLVQYRSILEHFENGTEPVVSGEESLKSLAVVEAVYISEKQWKAVSVADLFKL